ncbi:DUF3108 domain-containing protein [Sneathiella sp. P13V-1]|uniref:DUF3108 domain-containing protein n=1 Tax=Sneathiella sp. P13V-1 TaxID=2697366 RepID=UPI00187B2429|nr:DUF3108 domain-containing protein [Sneathiella sp. P13V-1]MBE7636652.1 DUF3108 domain-containing protein [Sneathiella sp. P13V-1]
MSIRNIALGTLVAVGTVGVAKAETLNMTHSVYLGGFFMGTFQTEFNQLNDSYSIKAVAKSNRKLDWFFTWDAVASSEGKLSGNKILPSEHRYQSKWKDEQRGAEILFQTAAPPKYELTGKKPNNPKKSTPLKHVELMKAVDPLTAIMAATFKLESDGKCNGQYPVFDGRRHYEINLKDIGVASFKKSNYSVFKGEAKGCRITYNKLGGFKKNSNFELEDDLDIYMAAPVPGGRIVPVRMSVDTELGGFELHLERYKFRDVQLASRNAK